MRLQLIGALAAVIAVRQAGAQPADDPAASATLRVYADDDHVTVVSPSAMVRAAAAHGTTVTVDTTVDAVSAASVDVTTSASPRAVSEQRIELGVAGTYRRERGPTWLTLGMRGSHETDYDAMRARVGARRELAQRNAALELTYVLGADVARSAMDSTFRATRTSHELMVTASQVLGPRSVADLIGHATIASGYHASPYRDVLVGQPASPLARRVPEATPRTRISGALAARLRWAVAARWATAATYRYYRDDWSIDSHTATAEIHRQLERGWLVGVLVRGYLQGRAWFYRPRYDDTMEVPALRTRDRTLGAMRSAHAALTLDVPVGDDERWHVVASLGGVRWWFLDFPAQADRDALLVHAGVTTTW